MVDQFSTTYSEEKIVDPTNVLLCFLLAVAVVLFIIGSIKTFDMDHYNSVILAVSTVFIYGLVVYVLLRPKTIKRPIETRVERVEVKTVEKQQPIVQKIEAPVVKLDEKTEDKKLDDLFKEPIKPIEEKKPEPVVEKPVEKPAEPKVIVKTVEKPVLSHITIEHPATKKLDIPKYDYRGSSETKIFHKATCRLSKSIKNKYKVSANDEKFFIKKGYTPCKLCIDKKRKGAKKAVKAVVAKVASSSKLPKLKPKTNVKTTHIKTTKITPNKKVLTTKTVEKVVEKTVPQKVAEEKVVVGKK